ncbi:transposable element Tcb2 transposase [Trichonephila clavipes]|nr:transposable element Tcb2 transposase [Trichonephila clavipes]
MPQCLIESHRAFALQVVQQGTLYLLSNVREIDHYDGGGLMVWAGIRLNGRTHLHVFERGSVTAVRYMYEALDP